MKISPATPNVAAFVVVRKNQKVAFVLRAHGIWMSGNYGLPSGKVEETESFKQCALREAKEEIGITVKPSDLIYLHTLHRQSEDSEWVDVIFEATKWQGEPYNAEPNVHAELAWLDPSNLPDNVVPPVRYALEQIAKGKQYSEYGWED